METEKLKLPHHEQLSLCTTRLPYRQGRKLTAVKVYTVNNESKHLLIFDVPSLNLRQETKALFQNFGKLTHFARTDKYPNEMYTDTYHAVFERIQSARIAKKMLDTKNFYGGVLHVCYAPELETLDDVRDKLLQRKKEVYKQLQRNKTDKDSISITQKVKDNFLVKENVANKLNMGEINTIGKTVQDVYSDILKRKTYVPKQSNVKKIKSCFIEKDFGPKVNDSKETSPVLKLEGKESNELSLNYNSFGNETIRKYEKPVNKIQFCVTNKIS